MSCGACHDSLVVEYGGGVGNGPAGQVGGGSGAGQHLAGGGDPFAPVGHLVDSAAMTLSNLTVPEMLLLVGAVLVGLVLLRRVLF